MWRFFLFGAAGYGILARSYSRHTGPGPGPAVTGVIGAPLLLAALLVAAPAVLAAAGIMPALQRPDAPVLDPIRTGLRHRLGTLVTVSRTGPIPSQPRSRHIARNTKIA
ncbi:hypothetical protein [Streptosporangium sp. KLBMP 9127]|nr:hypothetical protein [Streptosporangium sp. KLBMP 9127]